MDFRWVAFIALWTFFIGPVWARPVLPANQPRSQTSAGQEAPGQPAGKSLPH
jgi:hypothetical protein